MTQSVNAALTSTYSTPAAKQLQKERAQKTNSSASEAGFSSTMIMGKFEEGVKLMVATIKNQNPDNPMEAKDIAQQFSMFAQLMGMADIKKLLSHMSGNMDRSQSIQAASQLDNLVKVRTNTFNYNPLEPCELGFTAPGEAKSASVIITDSKNKVVRTIEGDLSFNEDGYHGISWDGKDFNGEKVVPGTYKFQVVAKDGLVENGGGSVLRDEMERPISLETSVLGRVLGANLQKNTLQVSGHYYPMDEIISIQSAKAFEDHAKAVHATNQNAENTPTTGPEGLPLENGGLVEDTPNTFPINIPEETIPPVLEDMNSLASALRQEQLSASGAHTL